jgi:hypothetical protein
MVPSPIVGPLQSRRPVIWLRPREARRQDSTRVNRSYYSNYRKIKNQVRTNHNLQRSCSSTACAAMGSRTTGGVLAVLVRPASAWTSVNGEGVTEKLRAARRVRRSSTAEIHITRTGPSLRTQCNVCPWLSMSGSNPKYFTSESRQLNRGGGVLTS